MHQGYEEINHYLAILTTRIFPDLGVIDGYSGMEGNGPVNGTPVKTNVAISSLDPLAADYIGLRCMGIDPSIVGYLTEIAETELGNYEEAKITVLGDSVTECYKDYHLHDNIDEQLAWINRESAPTETPA